MNTTTTSAKFQLASYSAGSSGTAPYRTFRQAYDRATWTFDDGVTVTAIERAAQSSYDSRGRAYGIATSRELNAKAKIYVDSNLRFDAVEDLTNRRRRPHNVWKPLVAEALARIGVEFDYVGWSQNAGCSCGCSPAFVPRDADSLRGWDFWVSLPDAPTVDTSKPARDLVAA